MARKELKYFSLIFKAFHLRLIHISEFVGILIKRRYEYSDHSLVFLSTNLLISMKKIPKLKNVRVNVNNKQAPLKSLPT